ncbi:hypothetical protein AN286_03500 [Aliarcobacter cryaerophilus ATCC 43158]|uniref:Uncharacterized protein n=1 Tax=Aliarcobacter cryaerophilus ATCC 43158 TaxID=1032070 RepID=A0AAD0TUK9_9BACT|nr:hypothetical protein [Aliarcobacter cryaerophilus]AYJ79245.1 hypothetical protein ACRYA_0076 [Aliarcobacter cryaerophilus ATCC 43158]QCZ23510.1 hypothetical protein AN286_03500 [Aliarcobacter cryaerophilus ATCC 43158]
MSTYSQEVLELKKEILTEISNELKNITNFKIKTNTKAYYELKKTISKWDIEINEISNSINHNDINEKFSFIKIDRKTLKSLIDLNNKLKFGSISKLLDILTINYEDLFIKDSLIEIKHFNLNKKTQMLLNNTDLYICEVLDNECGISSNEKILYKIDNVIIYENKEYLDAKNLKKYPIGEDIFWVSLNYTLADIEKFNSLYFNIYSNK